MKPVPAVMFFSFLALSGCGLSGVQKSSVAEFARATEGIGEFSARQLAEMRDSTIRMNTMRISLEAEGNLKPFIEERKQTVCGTLTAQEKLVCEADLDHDSILYEEFSVTNIAPRISAARALSSYGQLLLTLVIDTQEDEIKSASDNFRTSLSGIRDRDGNPVIEEGQLESVGIAVQAIGSILVEKMKADAVRTTVEETRGAVVTLCNLLSMDFDTESLHLVGGLNNTIQRLEMASLSKLGDKNTTLEERQFAMEAQKTVHRNRTRLETVVKEANQILYQLRTANSQLAGSLEQNKSDSADFSEIASLAVRFKALSNARLLFDASPSN